MVPDDDVAWKFWAGRPSDSFISLSIISQGYRFHSLGSQYPSSSSSSSLLSYITWDIFPFSFSGFFAARNALFCTFCEGAPRDHPSNIIYQGSPLDHDSTQTYISIYVTRIAIHSEQRYTYIQYSSTFFFFFKKPYTDKHCSILMWNYFKIGKTIIGGYFCGKQNRCVMFLSVNSFRYRKGIKMVTDFKETGKIN